MDQPSDQNAVTHLGCQLRMSHAAHLPVDPILVPPEPEIACQIVESDTIVVEIDPQHVTRGRSQASPTIDASAFGAAPFALINTVEPAV